MHVEVNNFTDMLLRNGYPLRFIQNQISQFLHNKYCKFNFKEKSQKDIHRPRIILKLPLIGDHLLHVEKEIESIFYRYLLHKLSLNVVHNRFKIADMFKHKKHHFTLPRSNVVYKLTCSCDSVYIGQTRRSLRARLDDHNPAANSNQQSDVAKHLLKNPTHFINFNEPEISCSAYNFKKRLIKETILIHQLQPDINDNILFMFNN